MSSPTSVSPSPQPSPIEGEGAQTQHPGDLARIPVLVEGISKRYKGGMWANRDISLAARPRVGEG